MENTKATVVMLNDLVQINNDRIKGFERAIKELPDTDADIKQLFTNNIAHSHQFKMELGTEVQALSHPKDIENTTTTAGDIHRAWMSLKDTFNKADAKSILEECAFGEQAIINAYQTVLQEEYLPAYIRQMLLQQLDLLERSHDEVLAIRNDV